MINLKKYSFNKYSEKYKQLFNKEQNKLRRILPEAEIEHIGSTSVEGLGGKGIIDVGIAVPKKEIKNTIKKLQKKGYDYRPFSGDKERKFFQKIIKYRGEERRVHIQLTHKNSDDWKAKIAVRNYLNKHKDAAQKYAQIKKEAIKYAKGDGKKYREYKKSFLDKLEKLAMTSSAD